MDQNSLIKQLLGATENDKFITTRSRFEAINQVLFSTYFDFTRETGRTHFLTSPLEEPAIRLSIKRLEKMGCTEKLLPLNERGQVTAAALEKALSARTALVSIAWASPVTGVIHPIEELASLCQARNVRLHVDASPIIGKLFFRFQDLGVDFLTCESGILHRSDVAISPFILGAPPYEDSKAVIHLNQMLDSFDTLCTETSRLKTVLERNLRQNIPDSLILFEEAERLPDSFVIAFPGISGELLQFHLESKKLPLISFRSEGLAKMLLAANIDPLVAHSALHCSLSLQTTEAHVEKTTQTLLDLVHQLRGLSRAIL